MCLIVFNYKNHPKYDLIFAANRDEFYERPTRAAQFWDRYPHVLAGKDLSGGGTWMGINRSGQIASLTNFRDPSITRQNPPSRGNIVIDYLTQKKDSRSFLKNLHQQAQRYMGFNVIAGSMAGLYHYSNLEKTINKIEPGIHGLSNELLDTPWPKVERAKSGLETLIQQNNITKEYLFDLLADKKPADEEDLPDTGIPKELEKQVSPIFIQTEDYGTRSSTILLIEKDNTVTFMERRFKPGSKEIDETTQFKFQIDH